MRRLSILLACAFLVLIFQMYLSEEQHQAEPALDQPERIAMDLPDAPEAEIYRCELRSFGALGDGQSDNSKAFREAIRSSSTSRTAKQRLLMEIPAGTFLTGSFNLTSKMTLRLLKGSKLLGVTNLSAYPLVPPLPSYGLNRDWAKDHRQRPAALISGFNLTDVIIEGEAEDGRLNGVVDGSGEWWWAEFRKKSLPFGRPSLIQFMYSSQLVLRGIVLQNPPFWNTHFYASGNVLVEHVRIEAPYSSKNTDGINLDSVNNAVVRHCVISTGDDAIAIKSGLNQAGINFGMPSFQIHLHDLEIRSKCLSLGSEMSGGIHDVLVENVRFGDKRNENRWHGIFIKSSRERGGIMENLMFRNISAVFRSTRQTKVFIEISMQYGKWNGPEGRGASQPPRFRNFTFRDLLSEGSFVVGNISGLPDSPVTDVTFENVAARNNHRGIQCMYAENVRILHGVKGHSCHSTHPDVVELDQLDPLPRGGKKAREDLINAVFGHRTLPSRSQPDQQQKIQEDLYELTWVKTSKDISRSFDLKSKVFHVPRGQGSRSAVLWHQGHHDCICPMFPAQPSPPGSKIPPGFQQGACAPGCMGYKHIKDHKLRRHATWWDLDNVTSFFRSLGHHVFILSMPLVGVNFDPQRSSNWTDHWWFQQQEALGDFTIRYFCEPVILTMNYALSLGLQDIHLAGLSGGAWTASIVAAMDQRVRTSIQVAGVLPYSMRVSADQHSSGDIGRDMGDFEQLCDLPPHPFREGARHIGYGWRKDAGRAYCKICNYRCQFLLGALEANRRVLQLYHEDDSCCYAASNRHSELRRHEDEIRRELQKYPEHGWFTAVVTDHRKHELSMKDKEVIAWVLRHPLPAGSPEWNVLPCDVLHGESNLAATCQIQTSTAVRSAARSAVRSAVRFRKTKSAAQGSLRNAREDLTW